MAYSSNCICEMETKGMRLFEGRGLWFQGVWFTPVGVSKKVRIRVCEVYANWCVLIE